jgi:hypothetical protein
MAKITAIKMWLDEEKAAKFIAVVADQGRRKVRAGTKSAAETWEQALAKVVPAEPS